MYHFMLILLSYFGNIMQWKQWKWTTLITALHPNRIRPFEEPAPAPVEGLPVYNRTYISSIIKTQFGGFGRETRVFRKLSTKKFGSTKKVTTFALPTRK